MPVWLLLPALSLAIVHIAGDNAGVVPDAAVRMGGAIWPVILLAYLFFGSALTAVVAWMGAVTGRELGVTVRRLWGCRGKKLLAVVALSVSLPASVLTGGYYAGWLVSGLTGLPEALAAAACLLTFTVLAAGYWDYLMALSYWCSLLLLPAFLAMFCLTAGGGGEAAVWPGGDIPWWLVLALFGYNAGGMRPALVAEAAARLRKAKGRAIVLAVTAKIVEGLFTLAMAYVVLAAAASGPLALVTAAAGIFGKTGGWLFAVILLCTFANAMIPAMTFNARQLGCCTGLAFQPALALAGAILLIATLLPVENILLLLAMGGPATAIFLACAAWRLHKSAVKQQ